MMNALCIVYFCGFFSLFPALFNSAHGWQAHFAYFGRYTDGVEHRYAVFPNFASFRLSLCLSHYKIKQYQNTKPHSYQHYAARLLISTSRFA